MEKFRNILALKLQHGKLILDCGFDLCKHFHGLATNVCCDCTRPVLDSQQEFDFLTFQGLHFDLSIDETFNVDIGSHDGTVNLVTKFHPDFTFKILLRKRIGEFVQMWFLKRDALLSIWTLVFVTHSEIRDWWEVLYSKSSSHKCLVYSLIIQWILDFNDVRVPTCILKFKACVYSTTAVLMCKSIYI